MGDRSAGGGGMPGSDLYSATLSALVFEASYGLGEGFAYIASDDAEELFAAMKFDRYLHARVDKVLAEQFAGRSASWRAIGRRSNGPRKRAGEGTLSADEVVDLMAEQPRPKLVDDDRRVPIVRDVARGN